ncbi:MAG: universal stress protein [Thermoleophilia bacterium]|nr:universal stress protein [Thermoleophilia bacterium]
MRTIVVGFDGSEGAEHALARALELAKALSGRVVVVSVAGLPLGGAPLWDPVGPGALAVPSAGVRVADQPDSDDLVRRLLDEARERVSAAGLEADYEARRGDPGDAIVAVADERGADLIVVGTREPGFLERLLAGSVSDDLARRAHCDVLIVHPPRARRG